MIPKLTLKVVGANNIFPEFELRESYEVTLDAVPDSAIHVLEYEGEEFLFEIKKTTIRNSCELLLEGILVDDSRSKRVGRIVFEANINQ